MIHDRIENLYKYFPKKHVEKLNIFLEEMGPSMEEGVYEIEGQDIYANIMSYNTKLREDCVIEAHDIYCDIQFSLIAEEGITVYPREALTLVSSDNEKDFYVFKGDDNDKFASVKNRPGYFTLLHVYDAHRPQESISGKCEWVKKGVIKIKEELFDEK